MPSCHDRVGICFDSCTIRMPAPITTTPAISSRLIASPSSTAPMATPKNGFRKWNVAALTALADRVVILVKGEVAFTGTPGELTATPERMQHLLGV